MTSVEGKNLLRRCFLKNIPQLDVDELILYKYGTGRCSEDYQKDTIVSKVDEKLADLPDSIRYVVKCFIHMDIYAAWPLADVCGSGKCILYKRDLANMEANLEQEYREVSGGPKGNEKIFLFRNERGIKEFIEKNF